MLIFCKYKYEYEYEKWAICCKRRRFRAKSYKIKIVRNTILNTFYFMTFFLGRILWPKITIEKDQFTHSVIMCIET